MGDSAGNNAYLHKQQLIDLGITSQFEVINSKSDITAPILQSYEISEFTFDVSEGDKNFL